jgi:precorrin-8X/cobalt-precorrin-8 methylmutase
MFDRFVVVDWSANSAPKLGRDSIWVAVLDGAGAVSSTNVATRRAAEALLGELLDPSVATLVGVDFSLGFPAGTAAALGLGGTPWSSTWELLARCIVDDERNANNRFVVASELNRRASGRAAPFWGCPPAAASCHLQPTKSLATPLAEFRATETCLRDQGRRPFSSWQLLGAGAVGSQSLLGIPMLQRLRCRFDDRLAIWPFTTGLGPPIPAVGSVVVTEVWPSMHELVEDGSSVRDDAQVRATVSWLAEADASGRLGELMSPALEGPAAAAVVAEEGWVLGVVP